MVYVVSFLVARTPSSNQRPRKPSRDTATDGDTISRFSPINLDEEIALACGKAVILKCKSVVLGRGGVSWVGPPLHTT